MDDGAQSAGGRPGRASASTTPPSGGSKIDDYREVIDGWLRADLTAPHKQRHTAKRIFDRLREEHRAEVSYSRVRAYVSVRRGEILAESGRAPVEVFVPQSHRPPGDEPRSTSAMW